MKKILTIYKVVVHNGSEPKETADLYTALLQDSL